MLSKNPYMQPTKQQIAQAEQVKKDLAIKKESLIQLAKTCMDDPKFKQMRGELEAFKVTVFKKLSDPMYADPTEDAYYLRSCINTMLVLDGILTKTAKNAKE